MKVTIVGVGMGNQKTLTLEASNIIAQSSCLIGAQRMLDSAVNAGAVRFTSCSAAEITKYLSEHPQYNDAAVLMSGDVGFYSGAKTLCQSLACCENIKTECVAGVSSVQYFCAKLCTSWEDAKLLSLHGRQQRLCPTVKTHAKTFALTGGENTVQALCAALTEAGLGGVFVQVGERLSYSDEHISEGTAEELSQKKFAPLSVMLVTNKKANSFATHGLCDEDFIRGAAPMTKAEVRTVSLAALRLKKDMVMWDIGAGTGSVSIEAARVMPYGAVYAVEKNADALELLKNNKKRFSAENLYITNGTAPQALYALPPPDAVFIGGSSGCIGEIIDIVLEKNLAARVVVNAITLETLSAVTEAFVRHNLPQQSTVQLSVSRAKMVGESHMMMGQNPVYIVSGGGELEEY
ncbi:MAG: precorrin-6Y C5,15-methyltransferase (decarboxylating) subunit CbiT [Hydrogenoanaerobacterium sp.]